VPQRCPGIGFGLPTLAVLVLQSAAQIDQLIANPLSKLLVSLACRLARPRSCSAAMASNGCPAGLLDAPAEPN